MEGMERAAVTHLPQPVVGLLPSGLAIASVADPWSARVVAVSRILAAQATNSASLGSRQALPVGDFRKTYLGGQVLAPERIDGWVRERALHDGNPSVKLMDYIIPPEAIIKEDADGLELAPGTKLLAEPSFAWARHPDPERPSIGQKEPIFLEYATPGHPHLQQAVNASGTLGVLRLTSNALAFHYYWTPTQATVFTLTGLVPIAATYPTLVMKGKGRRQRAMSAKHMELAAWSEEHLTMPLNERVELWNQTWPDWAYENPAYLNSDASRAERRLVSLSELES